MRLLNLVGKDFFPLPFDLKGQGSNGPQKNFIPSTKEATASPEKPSYNGDTLSLSYSKTTSLSLSFSATYTKVETIKGGRLPLSSSKDIALSLPGLKDIMKEVEKGLSKYKDFLDMDASKLSPEDMLKSLILKKMMGIDDIGSDSIKSFNFSGINSQKVDFSFDYSGVIKFNGSIYQTDFHLEFHLEQTETVQFSYSKDLDDQGLIKLDDKNIDTGRYLISMESASSVKIFDKFTKLSTTIWGDPHVNLSDKEGNLNGEFSDLKKSTILTSLKLLDKTTVVIKAPDTGQIEEVDVFKGNSHVKAVGIGKFFKKLASFEKMLGEDQWRQRLPELKRLMEPIGLFGEIDNRVDGLKGLLAKSDVVKAGGDGNDWYDENGKLIWGG